MLLWRKVCFEYIYTMCIAQCGVIEISHTSNIYHFFEVKALKTYFILLCFIYVENAVKIWIYSSMGRHFACHV